MYTSSAKTFLCEYHDLIARINISNGSGYYKGASKPKVGIITDDIAFNCFKDALDLEYIASATYQEQIEKGNLDFVFYISCWHGMDVGGEYHWANGGIRKAIEIIEYSKKHGIKTIFYSKEDPVSYGDFLSIAKAAEYIFTSAIEKVEDYKKDTGNDRVFHLQYGINPLVTNPIGCFDAISAFASTVVFAGSWYGMRESRCRDTVMLFDGVLASKTKDLLVIDRQSNSDTQVFDASMFTFPDKYRGNIVPCMDYKDIARVSKLFDWSLCLNIVTKSSSMCAIRVFEQQAMGVLLISNDALAVQNMFPNIDIAKSSQDVVDFLDGISAQQIVQKKLIGIRNIFSNSTVYDRLNYIYRCCDLDFQYEIKPVYILIENVAETIRNSITLQSYGKCIPVILGESELPVDGFAIHIDGALASRDYIQDLINAHKYTDVDYVRYGSQIDLKGNYNYTQSRKSNRNVLFSLRNVEASDIITNNLSDSLKGFCVYG